MLEWKPRLMILMVAVAMVAAMLSENHAWVNHGW